jgi:hypothetical protein
MSLASPCSRCGGRSFAIIEPARLPHGQSANGTIPLAVGALYASGGGGFFGGGTMHSVEVDAIVCETCGAVDLRARDLDTLRRLVGLGAARRVTVP